MEGDLSLSQSLGGLRIANPDDESPGFSTEFPADLVSPVPSRIPSAAGLADGAVDRQQRPHPPARSEETPPVTNTPPPSSSNERNHAPSSSAAGLPSSVVQQPSYANNTRNRQSMPLNHQAQLHQQFSLHSPLMAGPSSSRPMSSAARKPSRPTSNMYSTPEASSQPSRNGGAYRLRSESSRSSVSGQPKRSDSRSSSSAMQAGVPTREGSYSDRLYRPSPQKTGGNGPLPPRRSSRGMGTGHVAAGQQLQDSAPQSGSAYAVEGGPLPSSEEWKDRGAAMGIQRELDQDGKPVSRYVKKGVKDFNFGRTLGEGSYSTVIAATDRQTLKDYAIKVLDKRHIIKEKKVKYVNIEKDALNRLTDHPGIVRLYYTFQDERSLYFVLDVASGGELLGVLKRLTTFDEECTRFYGAQILDSVEYMHARGVIHRDLKPENVLLDDAMHVKIADFGTAKMYSNSRPIPSSEIHAVAIPLSGNPEDGNNSGRTRSFVGTAEYVSPELLGNQEATKACDMWAFGCIIYQLLAGRPPFKAGNEYQTFQKILHLDYDFPKGFPLIAMDLVERLLVLDPAQRLPIDHVKNHEFFDGIVWGRGLWRQKAPRLKSYVPPPLEPNVIKLNGYSDSAVPTMKSQIGSFKGPPNGGSSRVQPRVITELAPPSQLDIDWSPVLTRTNERILKLGNLVVQTSPMPHSPTSKAQPGSDDTPKKFSRFFGGGTAKKRERLVMITSSARILMAAAGGEEKKTKTEILLLAPGFDSRGTKDSRGFTAWCVETGEKLFTFEDPKVDSNSAFGAAMEWLETIDRAKEMAISQSMAKNSSYTGDDAFKELSSSLSSPASTLGGDVGMSVDPTGSTTSSGRLSKSQQASNDTESIKGRKRFSKRHSKNGLAAVF
ncbi:MAG: pkb-activating kinase-like protein [Sclerophora amabilis]|nr:MAG: pkb-activating kinase-like protein [Sclerophora amabilis]